MKLAVYIQTDPHDMIHTYKKLNVKKLSMFCFTFVREDINEMGRMVKKIIS